MNINGEYNIVCELFEGKYLYKLYYNDDLIYKYTDKYKPNELPKKGGNIKKLMDKINYNIINEKQLKKQKTEDLEKIINELKITLKDDELYFDDYQMTNNRVYTKNNNIIFNFIITDVKYRNGIFKITIKNSINSFIVDGTIEDILKQLNNKYLINNSMSNYKFVFNTLVSLVVENANNR